MLDRIWLAGFCPYSLHLFCPIFFFPMARSIALIMLVVYTMYSHLFTQLACHWLLPLPQRSRLCLGYHQNIWLHRGRAFKIDFIVMLCWDLVLFNKWFKDPSGMCWNPDQPITSMKPDGNKTDTDWLLWVGQFNACTALKAIKMLHVYDILWHKCQATHHWY